MSIVWFSVMDSFMDDWCMSNGCHIVDKWFPMDDSIETMVIIGGIFDGALVT